MSNLRKSRYSKNQKQQITIYSDNKQFVNYREDILINPFQSINSTVIPNHNPAKFNISQLANQQVYLSNLQSQIEKLKNQINILEREQSHRVKNQTIQKQMFYQQSKNHSISSKKSNIGKIYRRGDTPTKKRIASLAQKDRQSSYYQWIPQVDEKSAKYHKKTHTNQQDFSPQQQNKNKFKGNYRVKQKINKKPSQPHDDQKSSQTLKPKFKTEKDHYSQIEEAPLIVPQIVISKQQPVIIQIPEQSKQVFQFLEEWEIKDIRDDFQAKMNSKIQIPQNFPLSNPNMNDSLESHQQRGKQIYGLFKLNVSKFKEVLVVRKFKNGIYYQMKPDKNIIWYYNGSFYFGQWDTDLPSEAQKNGFGFQYIPNKYFYLGQFKNGTRNGNGILKLINKSTSNKDELVCYDCQWLNGKPHGQGKHIDEVGNKYIGAFQNGQKTGYAIVLNKDGLYYEGELIKGIKNGKGTQKLINGDTYTGEFLEGKFHGKGEYTWKNGSKYTGDFVCGIRKGKGIWKSYNGDLFEGDYQNDVKNGWGKFTWKNGQIYEGEFLNDIRNGRGQYKHSNGKIGSYLWKNGHIQQRLDINEPKINKKQNGIEQFSPIQ